MKKITVILLVSALLISCKQSEYRLVDLLAQEYMEKNLIPGLAWALVKDGEINSSGAYGMANVEKGVEMSIHGLMNVGSVTKTITATAIMQLWEQGKIDLQQDINHYLSRGIRNPHHPEVAITVRLLLTHTSSLIDGAAYYESYACGDPGISTNMFFTPDKKIGIIIFQNSNNGNLTELMEKIYSLETKD